MAIKPDRKIVVLDRQGEEILKYMKKLDMLEVWKMSNKEIKVKKIDEFIKSYKNLSSEQKKIFNKFYKEYRDVKFNEWLSQYSVEEINKEGLEIYRKIFDVMFEEGDIE